MNCIFLRRGYGTSGDGVNYVEYIDGTGEPCINTGFVANQDTRLVIDGQLLESYANNNFAGGRNTTSSKVFTIGTVNSNWRVGYNATSKNTGISADLNRHIFDANKNVFKVDGATVYTADYATFACTQPIYLFATKGNSDTPYAGQLRIYSCQIYDNGVLVRDLRPALDPNGVVCLYDKITKNYYYNVGTGTFTAGAVIGGTTQYYSVTLTEITGDILASGEVTLTANGKDLGAGTMFLAEGTKIAVSVINYYEIYVNGALTAEIGEGTPYYYTVSSNTTIQVGGIDMSITTS